MHKLAEDSARHRAARVLLKGSLILGAFALMAQLIPIIVALLRFDDPQPEWIYVILMLVFLIVSYACLRWLDRSLTQGMVVFIASATLCVVGMLAVYLSTTGGGHLPFIAFGLDLGVFALGLILGSKAAFWYASIVMLIALGFGFAYGDGFLAFPVIFFAYLMALPSWLVDWLERDLRLSEERFSTIVRRALDVILVLDTEDGRIISANQAAERVLGYQAPMLIGASFATIIDPQSEASFECLADALRSTDAFFASYMFLKADGQLCPMDLTATLISWGEGEAVLVTLRDITERVRAETERKRHEEELRKYREHLEDLVEERTAELEERNEELDAFSRTVAHDLQNPLALVIGYAEVLRDDTAMPIEQIRAYLGRIAKAGRKMRNIIQELLLLARLPKSAVKLEPLDMAGIVEEAQHRLVYMIEESQVEIIAPDTWPVAMGYGPWVEEVWTNYLSNAIKYGGHPPKVELGAKIVTDGALNGSNPGVCFWIRDNGEGLTEADQAQLFETFVQLHKVRAKGHGLGLSIVRRIVEKLGGEVGVQSDLGVGCTFSFTLPQYLPTEESDESI